MIMKSLHKINILKALIVLIIFFTEGSTLQAQQEGSHSLFMFHHTHTHTDRQTDTHTHTHTPSHSSCLTVYSLP